MVKKNSESGCQRDQREDEMQEMQKMQKYGPVLTRSKRAFVSDDISSFNHSSTVTTIMLLNSSTQKPRLLIGLCMTRYYIQRWESNKSAAVTINNKSCLLLD